MSDIMTREEIREANTGMPHNIHDACFGGCANPAQWAIALEFYTRYLRGVPLPTLLMQNKDYAKELTDLAIQIQQRRIRLDGSVISESPVSKSP